MIVASHQPNFLPYMGYFYKMYMCDVFTLSDSVGFSNSGYHNYNYIASQDKEMVWKITVPVSNKSGAMNEVELCQWEYNRKKLWKRLEATYCHALHFKEISPFFKQVFETDYKHLTELNKRLIIVVYKLLGFDCMLVKESDLNFRTHTPNEQIAEICQATGCNTYLSGIGAKEYLNEEYLANKGITVKWSSYKPETNLSVFDYLMNHGAVVPEQWKKDKEDMLCGRI